MRHSPKNTIPLKKYVILLSFILGLALALKTNHDLKPLAASFRSIISDAQTLQVTDNQGNPLSVSYQNHWNIYDNVPLYQIPDLLKQAFITSEDQQFFQHKGVNWRARFAALYQNLRHHSSIRGASTITEQVVRLLDPHPRHLWAKWVEGWEALLLERQFSKADILEFYLNQIPYAAQRRGVLQAAHYYFNRDLATLTPKEILALVVLARAPSSYDLYKNPSKINRAIERLAATLHTQHQLSQAQLKQIQQQQLILSSPTLPVNAAHFVSYVRQHLPPQFSASTIHTTLDANLQNEVEKILRQRLASLKERGVNQAAALIVDHQQHSILAWVVVSSKDPQSINIVTLPRQPGSALKPFLYSLALSQGWTAATILDDSPYSAAIGRGLHSFHNYSHHFYGKISLREALGNSLNIPALTTLNFVGAKTYLNVLHQLGFISLNRDALVYDQGLALGNGEVSLFELVQAYSALAQQGKYSALQFLAQPVQYESEKRIFSPEVSSLIANILSDPWARQREFGYNSVLNIPVQTAVKTGTSSDYHDAWAVGFNYRYTVGIWMGNLDQRPMDGITGALGPALALRSSFALLNAKQTTQPLFLSPRLISQNICQEASADSLCQNRSEYFIKGSEPVNPKHTLPTVPRFLLPTPGLEVAYDPRIPAQLQKLHFMIANLQPQAKVDWVLNNKLLATTMNGEYFWQLSRGQFKLRAEINQANGQTLMLPEVDFLVK